MLSAANQGMFADNRQCFPYYACSWRVAMECAERHPDLVSGMSPDSTLVEPTSLEDSLAVVHQRGLGEGSSKRGRTRAMVSGVIWVRCTSVWDRR
jgi:hypothetical protein